MFRIINISYISDENSKISCKTRCAWKTHNYTKVYIWNCKNKNKYSKIYKNVLQLENYVVIYNIALEIATDNVSEK